MNTYKERILECIDYLNSVRFPCEDWKEDKKYFDSLEAEFSAEAEDAETQALLETLKKLINDKRNHSLDMNKTTEELYAGWNDWF
ncbi:MAG: hypothetical protein IJ410_04175 [Oscillospiraceae bacterium]|nr:hypothetical protein [Oscillospiraceae bacterium]